MKARMDVRYRSGQSQWFDFHTEEQAKEVVLTLNKILENRMEALPLLWMIAAPNGIAYLALREIEQITFTSPGSGTT